MRLASINVLGLLNRIKRQTVFEWAKHKNISILCLQETFCTDRTREAFDGDWSVSVFQSVSDSPHSRGVSIMINNNIDFKYINSFKSDDGRRILINISNNENNRIQFFKSLNSWISQKNNK